MKCNINILLKNALVGLLGVSVLLTLSGCGKPVEKESPVRKVKVEAVKKSDIDVKTEYAGKLKAAQEVQISSKLSGKIATIGFELGDKIRKDQVIATLENDDIKAQLKQSKAGLMQVEASVSQQLIQARQAVENAQLQYNDSKSLLERSKKLYESEAISKKQLEDAELKFNSSSIALEKARQSLALLDSGSSVKNPSLSEAQLDNAKAANELANLHLDYSIIKAPIDGVLSMRNTDVGEMIGAGVPVFAVVDNSYMTVEIEVPDKVIVAVKQGDSADISLKTVSKAIKGEIYAVSPAADSRSGLYTMKMKVENPDGALKQGMMADISLKLGKREGVLTVPNRAIVVEDGNEYIFVNENGKVKKTTVKVNYSDEKTSEIEGPVKDGEEVVIEGQSFLNDGDRIKT